MLSGEPKHIDSILPESGGVRSRVCYEELGGMQRSPDGRTSLFLSPRPIVDVD